MRETVIVLYRSVVLQEGPHEEHSPLQAELAPVAWLRPQAFGGSLPSVVEWLPVLPHDLLLVNLCSSCSVAFLKTSAWADQPLMHKSGTAAGHPSALVLLPWSQFAVQCTKRVSHVLDRVILCCPQCLNLKRSA